MWKLLIILILGTGSILSCSNKENSDPSSLLVEQAFSQLEIDSDIHNPGNPIITVDNPDVLKKIVDKINASDRKGAAQVALEKGPEGLLIFKNVTSGAQTIEVPYFPESGDVLYKEYFIDCELNNFLNEK
ncbi:hypothetical protein [Paenibacillus wynnii]|uniref:hypothetical protein n=1 Tax=Paenibacillus wynnii TaxID=268407 RepID=UPI002791D905|nr:hypothetical protein [Paenibacillus wynnii]MDQ0196584.1 hypothetical protein [Paenibacillus wynnii]